MGPIETLRDITSQYYNELKKQHGLNPFDLLSWEALLNLELETRGAGRSGQYENRELHQLTRKMIWEALNRKAEDIDTETGTNECEELLEERRNGG